MDSFVRNLITEWRRLELPVSDETMVVAVSGGADSASLLLALDDLRKREKLEIRFVAAHFNHRLRKHESEADEDFVKKLAGERGFELALGHGKIIKEGNLEQNARDARYEFLRNTAENLGAFAVLTAHTINDQAETFLLNLIRGSGPNGLAGMKPVRNLESEKVGKGEGEQDESDSETLISPNLLFSPSPFLPFSASVLLVRPLLRWAKRADTERFCHDNGLEYRYDTMNDDLAFKRVRIRKILLPLLEEFNPKIIETLANTATLLQNRSEPPESAGGLLYTEKTDESDELRLEELKALPKSDLYQTLRSWLAHKRGNTRGLGLKHIEAIERLIFSRKSGKTVELPDGGAVVKSNGKLQFRNLKVEK